VRSYRTIAVVGRRTLCASLVGALSITLGAVTSSASTSAPLARATPFAHALHTVRPAAQGSTCVGTTEAPGVLARRYAGTVTVEGQCMVDADQAVVDGNLIVSEGSTLLAVFGLNDVKHSGNSSLTVHGTCAFGPARACCSAVSPSTSPAWTIPNRNRARYPAGGHIVGNLTAKEPLGWSCTTARSTAASCRAAVA
jgi:hypothetical protein